MSETEGKQSLALEDKALPAHQPHSRSREVSYDKSTPSTLPVSPYPSWEYESISNRFFQCQHPAMQPSPSSTCNGIDEATQTSIVSEESDTSTTTSSILSDPTLPQHAHDDTPTETAERFSKCVFPVLQSKLNSKIQRSRLVNRTIRNNLAKFEDCDKYLNTLKTMEKELEAEKEKTSELAALLRQAAKKLTASVGDWEKMMREHLE